MPPAAPIPPSALEAAASVSPEDRDARWFNAHIHPHEAQLKAYLRQRYPRVRDVDDVVQESYLRVWKARFVGQVRSAKAFLFRVAANQAIDHIRCERRSPVDPAFDIQVVDVPDTRADAAETAAVHDELNVLLDAIDSLPRRCREVVILRQLKGLSTREIARVLGMAEGTVLIQGAKGARRCEEYLRVHGVKRGKA